MYIFADNFSFFQASDLEGNGSFTILKNFHMFFQKMVNGGVVNFWACLNFSRGVQDHVVNRFCNELALMCQTSGMVSSLVHLLWSLSQWIGCESSFKICAVSGWYSVLLNCCSRNHIWTPVCWTVGVAGLSNWANCPSSECATWAFRQSAVQRVWECEKEDAWKRTRSSRGHSSR